METKMRIIAGPCQHESLDKSAEIAKECKRVCDKHNIDYYFKASYDKANRTSINGKRGVGLQTTMNDFAVLKEEYNVKTLTDVHNQNEILKIAAYYTEAVDVLQIPAFLCRQTDLIKAAVKTGKIVNIKKTKTGNWLIIDAGTNLLSILTLFTEFHKIQALNSSDQTVKYSIAGPLLYSSDVIVTNIKLPKQKIGDFININDVGAYFNSQSSHFLFARCATVFRNIDGKFGLVERKEEFEDIIKRTI